MKIAILGTKGIPNNYGGFEQFAEYVSKGLVTRGHSVTVYNPSYHSFSEASYEGVKIVRIYSPENLLGPAANFIYDHLCLKHALKQDFDIIYEAGYHSVALSYWGLGIKNLKRPVLITNMDGLEWKRSKWSSLTRKLIVKLEQIAVDHSPYLISDNEGIRNYYLTQFGRDSFFVPYGSDPMHAPAVISLDKYQLSPYEYFILVARLEPENNIESIIDGYVKSNAIQPLIVVGNHQTGFGKMLKRKFPGNNVRFVGGIYDKSDLDSLRYFSKLYFHGHSVGGTNPSLLEAMACKCLIASHDNEFNKSVLEESALYFSDSNDVSNLIKDIDRIRLSKYESFTIQNAQKIEQQYNWPAIVKRHEDLFSSLLEGKG